MTENMKKVNHVDLIRSQMEKQELDEKQLVERLNFKHPRRGARFVKKVLNGRIPMGSQVRKLANALEVETEMLEDAIDSTIKGYWEKRKKRMKFSHRTKGKK